MKADPLAARPGAELHLQHRIGSIHLVAHMVVVDLGDARHSRQDRPGLHVGMPVHVLEHEHDVVRRERLAVRPLRTLAQGQHHALGVVREFVGEGEIGNDAAVGRELQEVAAPIVHGLPGQVVPRLLIDGKHVQRTAVLADLRHQVRDRGNLRQPLVYRRQLSGGNQRGQHRRLLVLARRGGGGLRRSFLRGSAGKQGSGCENECSRGQERYACGHDEPPSVSAADEHPTSITGYCVPTAGGCQR